DIQLAQAGGAERARHARDHRVVRVGQHHVVDLRGAAQVARLEGHVGHGVDDRPHIVGLDVDTYDVVLQQFLLGRLGHWSCPPEKSARNETATSSSATDPRGEPPSPWWVAYVCWGEDYLRG